MIYCSSFIVHDYMYSRIHLRTAHYPGEVTVLLADLIIDTC